MSTLKLQDTDPIIGRQSRLENYWQNRGFDDFYSQFRGGLKLPRTHHDTNSLDAIVSYYKLKAIGFGNWVTQEDRFNYVQALKIAFFDLNRILSFPGNNIGLNTLSISFGARGKGKALAHYEPWSSIVNITRYHNDGGDKKTLWAETGGAGSLAHEYGHFLDYTFAVLFRNGKTSLSGGQSTRMVVSDADNPGKLHALMNDLINSLNVQKDRITPFRERLNNVQGAGDYFIRRNEIFARVFEQYIFLKLQKSGVKNHFLHDTKYQSRVYLTPSELEKAVPKMDLLIKAMKSSL
jgi:hypothetical protein